MAKSHLKLVAPTEVNRTVAPTRRPNAELRTREHLTPGEVAALIEAAKANRYGHRSATMILLAFRHGLRVAELCDLRWEQVEFNARIDWPWPPRSGLRPMAARTRTDGFIKPCIPTRAAKPPSDARE